MVTCNVIFGRNHTVISLGIQLRTLCRWSHVGIIDGDYVIEARGGHGVVRTHIEDFKKRYIETEIREIYCKNDNFIHDVNQKIGTPYDHDAFWGIALGVIGWDDINAYQCAELVGKYSGIFDKELCSSLTPKDIRKVSHATLGIFKKRIRK